MKNGKNKKINTATKRNFNTNSAYCRLAVVSTFLTVTRYNNFNSTKTVQVSNLSQTSARNMKKVSKKSVGIVSNCLKRLLQI
jgi:hypothetical protein